MIQGENPIAAKPSNEWWRMPGGHDVNLRIVETRGKPQLAEWFRDP